VDVLRSTFGSAGVYLCVKAYGDQELTFSLKATLSKCPADFSSTTGEKMECSSVVSSGDKRHTGCNDDGTCICKPPYVKPLAETYEGKEPSILSISKYKAAPRLVIRIPLNHTP
jgi:hypothetical protein